MRKITLSKATVKEVRKLKPKFLLHKSTNRAVYLINGVIYKKALNKLGLESNKNECELSGKSSVFNETELVTKDYHVIKAKYIENYDINNDKFAQVFNITRNNLAIFLEYKYFTPERMLRRMGCPTFESKVKNDYPEYVKVLEALKAHTPNDNLSELVRVVTEYNLEPSDILKNIVFVEDKPLILDFGLSEDNYFKNMFILKAFDGKECVMVNPIIKQFNNKFYPYINCYWVTGLKLNTIIESKKIINPRNNILGYDIQTKEFSEFN